MGLPFAWVDAFTDEPFKGNAAGVCFLTEYPAESLMMNLSGEMSLAEIAYLLPDGRRWRIRWFTPAVEIDLCGHATLAAAHVLWETERVEVDAPIEFLSNSGPLIARRVGEGIQLDFPAVPSEKTELPAPLRPLFGDVVTCAQSERDLLIELPDEETVRNLRPDFRALERALESCLIVTARSSDPRFDFVSRFFAPNFGIDEDPVTGSAHCLSGPYWAKKLGKSKLRAYQASARGGILDVEVLEEQGRVLLGGKAVTLLTGELHV